MPVVTRDDLEPNPATPRARPLSAALLAVSLALMVSGLFALAAKTAIEEKAVSPALCATLQDEHKRLACFDRLDTNVVPPAKGAFAPFTEH